MKKLLFVGSILFSSLTFASTGNLLNFDKLNVNDLTFKTLSKELNKDAKISNVSKKVALLRTYYTIEFDIDCGNGTGGHMTVSFPSDNTGLAFIVDLVNAINSGAEQGCQKISEMGL